MPVNDALLHNAFYGNYGVRLVAALGFAYLLGSIPVEAIARWLFAGLDPRLGRAAVAFGSVIDVLKGFVATAIVFHGGGQAVGLGAGLAATLGHYYCAWRRFRGGERIDFELGVVLALCPPAALVFLVFWVVAAVSSRSAAIGSVFASALLFLPLWYFAGAPAALFGILAGTALALRLRADGQTLERV